MATRKATRISFEKQPCSRCGGSVQELAKFASRFKGAIVEFEEGTQ